MHVADIEKTIKGYIWTCLPSIFQDRNLVDPENSERGDGTLASYIETFCFTETPRLGPTPKSAYALLLFRQSRFRWQVVSNQTRQNVGRIAQNVLHIPLPDQSIEERRLLISEVNKKNED